MGKRKPPAWWPARSRTFDRRPIFTELPSDQTDCKPTTSRSARGTDVPLGHFGLSVLGNDRVFQLLIPQKVVGDP